MIELPGTPLPRPASPAAAGPFAAPQAPSADAWRLACVPLGAVRAEGAWAPLGAGVLFVDAPVLWLLTTRSVVEGAQGAPVGAWVPTTDGAHAVVDLSTGRRGTPLDWVLHPERDLAATVFPIGARLVLKAFSEAQTLPDELLAPLLPVAVAAFAHGLGPAGQRPAPLAFAGALAGAPGEGDPAGRVLLATAPLPPRNAGAPLLAQLPPQAGGGVALAGIATHATALPEPPTSLLPPVRLTVALPVAAALSLVRGEAGKAARQAALVAGK